MTPTTPSLRDRNLARLSADVHDVLTVGSGINGAVSAAVLAAQGASVALVDRADASYLTARTDTAETMRRLLLAGGVAVATATSDAVTPEAIAELERLLGPGAMPTSLKPELILADLPSRIEQVRASVPPVRRAQVIRDLCVIARADGSLADAEVEVIEDIAEQIEVDSSVVACALDPTSAACASQPHA